MVTPSSSQAGGSASVAQAKAVIKKSKAKAGKAKPSAFTCIRFAHGCANTVYKKPLVRLHPGPDGPQTLCPSCNRKYRQKTLPVFADANHKVSAVPFPGSHPAVVIAFNQRSRTLVPLRIEAISHSQRTAYAPGAGGQTGLRNTPTPPRNRIDSDRPVQSSAPVKEEDQLVMVAEDAGVHRADIAMKERQCTTGPTGNAPQSMGGQSAGVRKSDNAFTQEITNCASTLPLQSNIAAKSCTPRVRSFNGHAKKTRAETTTKETACTFPAASATERAHGSKAVVGAGKTPADHLVAAGIARVNPETGSSWKWDDEPTLRNAGSSRIGGAANACVAKDRTTWGRDQLSSCGDDRAMPVAGPVPETDAGRHASPEPQRDPATPLYSTDSGRDVLNVTIPAVQSRASRTSRLSVKASMGASKPARRFTIERGLSYQALADKMRDMFDLKAGCLLSYEDNEGDNVCVSSNNEVDEMIHLACEYSICPMRLQVTASKR